jgi:hypothetical protein
MDLMVSSLKKGMRDPSSRAGWFKAPGRNSQSLNCSD